MLIDVRLSLCRRLEVYILGRIMRRLLQFCFDLLAAQSALPSRVVVEPILLVQLGIRELACKERFPIA